METKKGEPFSTEKLKWEQAKEVPKDLDEVKKALEELAGLNKSYDVKFREMVFAGRRVGLYYYNGFVREDILTEVLKRLSYVDREQIMPSVLKNFLEKFIPHIQVEVVHSMPEMINQVLAGNSALFIENESSALILDSKSYPLRGMEEPSLEKVVRGPRDGFVESVVVNQILVRRRIRDPRLTFEIMQVGTRTLTDVCIAYISDIVDMNLVESIKDKIKNVKIDGIPLGDKELEEIIVGNNWNPYPLVRYSERPDVIAVHLLEGHVVVFVDNSPSAMIMPTTVFHLVQHAEEYRQEPFIGTYLRWIRFFGIWASVFLLPLWFLFVTEPELKPEALDFIGPREEGKLPLLPQFLLAEVGLDLLRMAAVHTPTPLASAMGLIAAIIIGEFAVNIGLFVNEVVLYIAVAAIGMFATPSHELSMANRISRLFLLIAVAFFKVPGLLAGTVLLLIMLITTRSYNAPYMWPFIPFDAKALFSIVIRRPANQPKRRLALTKPEDSTRKPQ